MGTKSVKEYHMGLPDAERMFKKLADLGCIDNQTVKVVNHFSHNGEMTYDQLASWGTERGILAAYTDYGSGVLICYFLITFSKTFPLASSSISLSR